MSKDNDITRKEALKQMGGLALGSTFLSSLAAANTKKSGSSFPNIITKRASKKPNVLWITSEGTPISLLSCYKKDRWGDLRSDLIDTPNIGRIAKEGMRFKNSFVTNALCAPSRATLLTGKYDHLNGMINNPPYVGTHYKMSTHGQPPPHFDPSQETFPKIMRRNGYQTAIMGKWHLTTKSGKPTNPGKAGFDKFAFKLGAGTGYYNPKGYLQNSSFGSTVIQKESHKGYTTDVFTGMAIQTMKEFQSNKKPFLMMMQFFNDHRSFQPPHKYEDMYIKKGRRIPEPSTFWDHYEHRASVAKEARLRVEDWKFAADVKQPKGLTPRQRKQWNYQKIMNRFLGTYKAQDDNVGRLLHYLDQAGLADNTIVVYTSDHGFFLGEHGWLDKRFMYEQSIRVPWLIRYPGMVEKGSTTDLMGVNIDNAPTVLDLVNMPVPKDMQGRSLKPILQGKTPSDWRKSYYAHYYEFAPPHWVLPYYGVRTERYKIISYYTENQWELFDLKKDPDEMESLFEWAGYKIHPDYVKIARNLVNELKQLRKKYKDNTGKPVKLWPTSTYE
jgi:arylsulfatase A-like enzyme